MHSSKRSSESLWHVQENKFRSENQVNFLERFTYRRNAGCGDNCFAFSTWADLVITKRSLNMLKSRIYRHNSRQAIIRSQINNHMSDGIDSIEREIGMLRFVQESFRNCLTPRSSTFSESSVELGETRLRSYTSRSNSIPKSSFDITSPAS